MSEDKQDKHAAIYDSAGLVKVLLWDGRTASFPAACYVHPWGDAHEWAEKAGATTVEVIPPIQTQR